MSIDHLYPHRKSSSMRTQQGFTPVLESSIGFSFFKHTWFNYPIVPINFIRIEGGYQIKIYDKVLQIVSVKESSDLNEGHMSHYEKHMSHFMLAGPYITFVFEKLF